MSTITDAVAALARGEMILVVDDEDRENEGDLIMAAEHATTDSVAFFLEHTSGFLCVAIDEPRAEALALDRMVRENTDPHRTAFLVSVDCAHGTSTGISAGDRAATIRALAAPETAIPPTCPDPGTCCRCSPSPVACSNAPATPRPAWTCASWPDSAAPRCYARSSPRTGAR